MTELTIGSMPKLVSIHAPVKGATQGNTPRPASGLVSIHAPVKGATRSNDDTCHYTDVSIHAPVKGATVERFSFGLKWMFQFTLP